MSKCEPSEPDMTSKKMRVNETYRYFAPTRLVGSTNAGGFSSLSVFFGLFIIKILEAGKFWAFSFIQTWATSLRIAFESTEPFDEPSLIEIENSRSLQRQPLTARPRSL